LADLLVDSINALILAFYCINIIHWGLPITSLK